MTQAEADSTVAEIFPGIRLDYLRLLLAARGCAEAGVGQQPMLAVDGPSGAGKSLTVRIAAAAIGDEHANLPWSPNNEHFEQCLFDASMRAGLVTCDEIVKGASSRRVDFRTALNPLLTFTPGSMVRRLYTGPVVVRQVPVIVLTDIAFPREFHVDQQLGRRFVHVHLERAVDWQRTAQAGVDRWRTLGPQVSAAANSIASDVVDRYFASDTPPIFEEIAADLGFGLLNQQEVDFGVDGRDELRGLFGACCGSAAVSAPIATWHGRGWKLITRDGTDPLSHAWLGVCDDLGAGFTTSRRVKEVDWANILGVQAPVECDLSPHGNSTLAIRFRCGGPRSSSMRVNEKIAVPQPAAVPATPAAQQRENGDDGVEVQFV